MITKEQAMSFDRGKELWHVSMCNADHTPVRCRVNGQCKTWATRPEEFALPVKHGLKQCFYIDHTNSSEWYDPQDPLGAKFQVDCVEPTRDTLHLEEL